MLLSFVTYAFAFCQLCYCLLSYMLLPFVTYVTAFCHKLLLFVTCSLLTVKLQQLDHPLENIRIDYLMLSCAA